MAPTAPKTILPSRARSYSYTAGLAGLAEHMELSALDFCQEVVSCCESFAEHGWDLICCALQRSSLALAFFLNRSSEETSTPSLWKS